MNDIIDKLSGNSTVIIGLSVLLGILIILFIIVLFSGKAKKSKKENIIENKIEENIPSNDIDFDHSEYVKETTAEFELTPVADLKPVPDEFVPEVKEEESPALVNTGEIPLPNFNFDELSKSISAELEKLKEEETTGTIPADEIMDAFREVETVKPVEIPKLEDNREINITPSEGPIFPEKKEEIPSINEPVIKEEETPLFARFNQETYEINKKD